MSDGANRGSWRGISGPKAKIGAAASTMPYTRFKTEGRLADDGEEDVMNEGTYENESGSVLELLGDTLAVDFSKGTPAPELAVTDERLAEYQKELEKALEPQRAADELARHLTLG